MKAEGLLFLTLRPYHVLGHAGAADDMGAWMFTLIERTSRGDQRVIGMWSGDEGNAFVMDHFSKLRPGCAVQVQFAAIGVSTVITSLELQGTVESMRLAPDRWPRLPHRTPAHMAANQL